MRKNTKVKLSFKDFEKHRENHNLTVYSPVKDKKLYFSNDPKEYKSDIRSFSRLIKFLHDKGVYPHRYLFSVPSGYNKATAFRFDIDLSLPNIRGYKQTDIIEPLYTKDQALKAESVIRSCLSLFLFNLENLESCILTKEPYVDLEKSVIKHGIHIEFPKCFINNNEHRYIIERCNRELVKIFPADRFKPDDGFYRNSWLVYGGVKCRSYRLEPYVATYWIDGDGKEVDLPYSSDSIDAYVDLFWLFPREGDVVYKTLFCSSPDEDIQEDTDLDIDLPDERNIVKAVSHILYSLPLYRVSDTPSWRRVCMSSITALREGGVDDSSIRQILDDWSRTTTKNNYSDDGVDRLFMTYDSEPDRYKKLGMNTLKSMLKWDSKTRRLLLSGTDQDMAEILYMLNKGKIVMIDEKRGYYYNDKDKLWLKGTSVELWNKLYDSILTEIKSVSKCIYKEHDIEVQRAQEAGEKKKSKDIKRLESEIDCIKKAERAIGNNNNVYRYMARLTYFCQDKTFGDRFNSNPDVIPIKGGKVLSIKSLFIRDRTKSDYFDFELDFTLSPHNTAFGERFFMALSNERADLCIYMACLFSYFMTGYTFDRSIYQFLGSGLNGKSTYISIIEKLLSTNLVYSPGIDLIKEMRKYGSTEKPSPSLINCRGKRLITINESNDGDVLDTGKVKSYTGGDTVSCRGMYSSDMESFKMIGKIVVCSNNILEFNMDKAMGDRCKYVPFDNTFEKSDSFLRSILNNEDGKLDSIASYALITARPYIEAEKLPECKLVSQMYEEIMEEIDIIPRFIEDRYEIDPEGKIGSNDMYNDYIDYCRTLRVEPMGRIKFCRDIVSRGFTKKKLSVQTFMGLKRIHTDGFSL